MISRETIRPSLFWGALLLLGCGYEAHSPEGALPYAPDGSTASLDAGATGGPGSEADAGPPFLMHEHPAVQATIAAWRERYLIHGDVRSPDGASCIEAFARLETVVVDPSEFRRLCHRCEPDDPARDCEELGRANACAPVDRLRGPDGGLGEPRSLIVVSGVHPAGTPVHQRLVIHETIHHLGRCTGDGIDRAHTRSHYWCTGGDDCTPREASSSINARGRAFLPDGEN